MKFKSTKLKGRDGLKTKESVFDPEAGEYIAEFVDGLCEVDDPTVCSRLRDMGYEVIPEAEPVQAEEPSELIADNAPAVDEPVAEEPKRKRGKK